MHGGRRSRSGKAGSVSGAGSSSASSPARGSSAGRVRACGCSWTRSRRGCCSRRGSGAGATGSTRSCSASRPTCRGDCGSTPSIRRRCRQVLQPPGYHPTFLYEFIWDILGVIALLLVDRYFKIRRPALFALYVSIYTLRALLRGVAPHRSGARVPRAAAERVGLGRRLRASTAFFIWWQFIRSRDAARTGRARAGSSPEGPAMAVPKGRVRSGTLGLAR